MNDFLAFVCVPALALGALSGALIEGANAFGQYQCQQYEQITGRPTKYVQFDECYVQRDGKWMRWDEYKLAYAATSNGDAP